MAVLVTGGAGYIGSHTVAELLARGEDVVIVDSLETGHKAAVLGGKLYDCDLRDEAAMKRVFAENEIDAVIHFAANSLVGESMTNPAKYYHNNVYGTLCLLERMQEAGVKRIVFSSTAATYGNPERVPIEESDRTEPTNAYGETKLAMERMMRWFDTAHGMKFVSLRYFNACGAHDNGLIGEDHNPETHLVPVVLQVALGKRESIAMFGDDYPTPDGTCVRDYIHVMDLADAHVLALKKLREGGDSAVYNLGNGKGYSVREVVEAARRVTGHPIPAKIEPRRAGDPAILVASSDRTTAELGWKPQRASLEAIIESAWRWHQAHPNGYEE
ncbi:UDP-glucose 4-epimerase GalE [Paenibacillus sp. TRM 82003]|nr:UDP-glucose 4-epimerase GalE [Paenibacillus sp. TRM 82003]